MASLSEIGYSTNDFFENHEYIAMEELLNQKLSITDVKFYENEKGCGVAAAFKTGDQFGMLVTHSIGIYKTLSSEAVKLAIEAGVPVDVILRKGKSKKTGNSFYYLE